MFATISSLTVLLFIASTIIYLTINPKQCSILLHRFQIRGRNTSQSHTPPRSVSPQEKGASTAEAAAPDYRNVFPPSRREAFGVMYDKLPAVMRKKTVSELVAAPDEDRLHVPLATPEEELVGNEYTPCGFSVNEIRQLGDFPEYAALSGVPLPTPHDESFDINKAKPRPYRPFRWAYHQTMSLAKLDTDYWLELESDYKMRIRQRQEIYAKHGKLVLQHLPGSELACKELMEMCLQFICARYPQYFSLSHQNTVMHNKILGTETNLKQMHPLHVLLNNVPEDFAITLRDPKDGYYSFRAGVVCSALGWNVDTKIGLRLNEIHNPVPDYKEKMQFSMDRYFARKPTDRAIQRGSWGFEVDTPLFMPPGDPHEAYRTHQSPLLHSTSRIHLRVDWQTLRRLPLTGAIIFNFKALFTPVDKFREEKFIPALALKVLNEGKKNIMEYKATWHTEHVVRPALEEWKREQEERGWVGKDWEVQTLDETPFFPGWEEKWRGEQGF